MTTYPVTFSCPRCGDDVRTEVIVSGRHWQSREIIVDDAACESCGYGYAGPELMQLAQDQFDADADAFARYGRDDDAL